jgi:hypothetical protein
MLHYQTVLSFGLFALIVSAQDWGGNGDGMTGPDMGGGFGGGFGNGGMDMNGGGFDGGPDMGQGMDGFGGGERDFSRFILIISRIRCREYGSNGW